MKTGIQLITEERYEQISKHGYTNDHDKRVNEDGELITAAIAIIGATDRDFPPEWNYTQVKYMCAKSYKERLSIAGALIAAEIDRLNGIH